MSNLHRAYLNLGSNIQPELNLPKAINLLKKYGDIKTVSHVWESRSVGYDGPNFLNVCVLFLTESKPESLKAEIIHPIEAQLGRLRGADKNMPRTMDIDVVLFDDKPIMKVEYWDSAFVIVPLAELLPEFVHPVSGENLARFSEQLQRQVWIVKRTDVII
jgi:2-amino-4-hydroxy-6-hydroxymethyldihydropteridine diphosphokinase